MINISNTLKDALAAYVESKNPDVAITEIADVEVEIDHYSGGGCSDCGYECETSAQVCVTYYHAVREGEKPSRMRTDDRWSCVSIDVNGDDFAEFMNFIASHKPNA